MRMTKLSEISPDFPGLEITLDNVGGFLKRIEWFEAKFECDFNKFYQTDKLLFEMLKLPSWSDTKIFKLDHAVFLDNKVLPYHLESKQPLIVFRPDHVDQLKKAKKEVYLCRNPTIEKLKKLKSIQTGIGTVVFPGHSTHLINATYDSNDFINELNQLPDYFGQVSICLYWKDIINGMHIPYLKSGFRVVAAGHMEDPLFFKKMADILLSHKFTCSNEIGSYTFYSIAADRPFFMLGPPPTKLNSGDKNSKAGIMLHKNSLEPLFRLDAQKSEPQITKEILESCKMIFHSEKVDERVIRKKIIWYNLKIQVKRIVGMPKKIVKFMFRKLSIRK